MTLSQRSAVAVVAATLATMYAPLWTRGARVCAQVSTGTISGTVRMSNGVAVDDGRVRVVNRATGFAIETELRAGRFLVPGLEVGGPYVVEVRRIGLAPQERRGLHLALGQELTLQFVLDPLAGELDTVHVLTQAGNPASSRSRSGVGTTIPESLLRGMPALNRDVLDFARFVPAVGTRFGGLSGAGIGFRFNSYLIDGVTERLLLSNGTVTGIANGKLISIDAVKAYEVVLAPYDVRYGDFAGAMVNAVTKSGTNELLGTAFVYGRSEALARNTAFLRGTPYKRSQSGFTLGGPLVRNRLHFFVSTEFQRYLQPALGPYIGQSPSSAAPVPVSRTDVERFQNIMRGYGLDPGSGGRVMLSNPSANVFARLDVALPALRSRAVLRQNYSDASLGTFNRSSTSSFALSSNAWNQTLRRSSTTIQLFTNLPSGALNELSVSRGSVPQRAAHYALAPLVNVIVPRSGGGANATLVAGAPENAQGQGTYQTVVEIGDHLVMRPRLAHTLSVGARGEFFGVYNTATRRQFGTWTFSSLDSFALGAPTKFILERDFGSATARLRGAQFGAYLGDAWQSSPHVTLDVGIRADLLTFGSRPLYNRAIDSIFGRRTDAFARPRLQWSPRLGFSWDLDSEASTRVRGGAGVFVGRGPLSWIIQSLRFDGVGTRALNCDGALVAPRFVPSALQPPSSCADGTGFTDGLVNLMDPQIRMPEMFRSSLAYDRMLPWSIQSTVEALYTRTRSDFYFANPNLVGPQGYDRHGRVLYGSLNSRGDAVPILVSRNYSQLVDLRNHSAGHSIAITGRLDKRVADTFDGMASYTRSRVRDLQSLAGPQGQTYNAWATGRTMSGRHEDLGTGVSSYEIAHRVVLGGTWTAPWRRWSTDFSLYYVGESGVPFTYTDSSAAGRGDLNADGTNANDPIYIPLNAADTSEIVFDGPPDQIARQQDAFERFVATTPCLRRQRGQIMTRNSCRAPWVHSANTGLRQSLPSLAGHEMSLRVEVFNVLNLLNKHWGLYRVPNTALLQHVRQTSGPTAMSQPIFFFPESWQPYNSENAESAYQIQLALRYRF